MYFTQREWLEILGIGAGVLVFLGGPIWLLIRAGRRYTKRLRDALVARPLVSYSIDTELARQFIAWRINQITSGRRQMWPRLLKIGLWVTGIITLGFMGLGFYRDMLLQSIWVGLVFSAIIMGSAGLAVLMVTLIQTAAIRKLRRAVPQPAQVYIGMEGIVIEPGDFQSVAGALWRVGWHNGTPTVLELVARRSNQKGGHTWSYSHAPVPAHETQRVDAAIAPLKAAAAGQNS